jgi:hypothetical protein
LQENECAVISMTHVLHVDSEISDSYKIRHGQIVGFKVLKDFELKRVFLLCRVLN